MEKVAREAAGKLELRADLITLDIEHLTDLLEQYREEQSQGSIKGLQPKVTDKKRRLMRLKRIQTRKYHCKSLCGYN